MPIYLLFRGWNVVELGFLISIGFIVEILGSVLIGYSFDRGFQPKFAMFAIDLSYAFVHLMYAMADEKIVFFLAYSLTNFLAPLSVAYQTLEKEFYPEDMYEKAFSIHMAFPNGSQLFAMLFFGAYLTYFKRGLIGFKTFYAMTSILYLLSSIYIILFIPKTKKLAKAQKFSLKVVDRNILLLAIAELIIIFGYQIAPEFVYLYYLYDLVGLNIFLIAITLSLANIGGILGGFLANHFEESRKYINFAVAMSAIFYGVFYLAKFFKSEVQIFLISCFLTFSTYLAHTIWFIYHRSILFEEVPSEHKGKIFGFITSGRFLIYTIAPILASHIASIVDPLTNYLISSAIIFSAIVVYKKYLG